MAQSPSDPSASSRPPLGSWSSTYLLVAALAIVVMLLLYWFTAAFNIPLVRR